MDAQEPDVYTRSRGNIGEGTVLYTCLELLKEETTILMLGGSPYLWADFITAGAEVVLFTGILTCCALRERNWLSCFILTSLATGFAPSNENRTRT